MVREQLGPGMGDQAIVAIDHASLGQDSLHCQYAQYAIYLHFSLNLICTICKQENMHTILDNMQKYVSNMQKMQNVQNMQPVIYAKNAKIM